MAIEINQDGAPGQSRGLNMTKTVGIAIQTRNGKDARFIAINAATRQSATIIRLSKQLSLHSSSFFTCTAIYLRKDPCSRRNINFERQEQTETGFLCA